MTFLFSDGQSHMAISNQEKELLRKYAKDEQSYQQLLELFEKSSSTELDTDLTQRVDLAFLDNAPSAIIICDARQANNPIVFVNKRFEQDTGYTREEVMGKNPRFMQGDDQQQAALTILRQALQNQEGCRVLLRNYRKDGTGFWNQVDLAPIRDTSGIVTHYISVQNDVTSQINLQEELQQRISGRLNRYRNMVYSTQDGLALINRDYIYEIVNDIYLDRSGLKRGEIEGYHVAEIMGEEIFQNIVKGHLDRSLAGETVRHEDWVEFAESGRRYIRLIYSPYRDENENGSVIGVLVNSRDITDNKHIEDELRESEARYRTVVQNFPNGLVALYDHDLRYTLVDGTGLAEIGLSPADLEGKKLRDVFPPEIYERDEPQLLAALNGEATDTVVTLGEDYFRVMTIPLRNPNDEVIGGMVMSQNISPLKRAEEALRESEEKYRVLVETNPDLISRLTQDSTHLYANTSLLKFLGKSPEQVIGKTNADIGVPQGVQVEFDALREQVFTTAQEAQSFFSYPTPDGIERDFHLRLIPEFDSNDNVISVLSITRDITVHNLAQQQAFDLALERERRQLLTNFIKDVAHEFRTPLSTITTSAYLMSRVDDAQSRHTKQRVIELQVRRIIRLVDTLLLQSKIQNMDFLSHSQVNITRLLNLLYQQALTKYGDSHDIQYQAYPDALIVSGDEEYLSHAIRQIIDNACRFTEHGSKITLSATKEANKVLIRIRDNGGNIPDDALPDIFKTFWRRDTAHSSPGLGLGLPIAKQIIELHKGTISVESEPGIQNTFQIRLPLIGVGVST